MRAGEARKVPPATRRKIQNVPVFFSRVAGKRRAPAKCAGRRPGRDLDTPGESPGTRYVDEQTDRRPRRRRATQSRQRHAPRETHGVGRTRAGACGAVYGGHCCRPVQSGDPGLLSALAARGKGQEGGPHRVHAQVADDPQCGAETSDALAADGGAPCLNPKTVADTFVPPPFARPGKF